ncbi:MAG: hypothetical protein GF387_02455 [Candidatus Portnoybacteria bacterium]|nr:hypothetical protein [Candidatus Portnoybacteria bacterium]
MEEPIFLISSEGNISQLEISYSGKIDANSLLVFFRPNKYLKKLYGEATLKKGDCRIDLSMKEIEELVNDCKEGSYLKIESINLTLDQCRGLIRVLKSFLCMEEMGEII